MDLMWLISVLKILPFFIFDTATALTIVKQGDSVTLACTDSPTIYPTWVGPPDNTLYNYIDVPMLNPILGEKLSRLSWDPDNNKSLIICNVMTNDSGTYNCRYSVDDTSMITTHELSVRVLPQPPVISNAESLDGTRTVVIGTDGQELTLQCTSTGGYPEPLLYWYKDNTQTQPLDITKTSQEGSDGTYKVEVTHTFTPSNQDDDVTFVCQSSFSPPQPSKLRVQVQLLLNLKPSQPIVTSYTVDEGVSDKVAECRTTRFRPDNIYMWFQMNGNNITSNTVVSGDTGQKFSAVASYTASLQRQQNGKLLVCYVAHQTLQTPLTGSGTADVRCSPVLRPRTMTNHAKRFSNETSGTKSSNDRNMSVLVIEDANRTHGGQYTCKAASNLAPNGTAHTNVTIKFRPLTAALTGSVTNIVAESNANITLICTSGSSNPKSLITWHRGGVQIPNPAAVTETNGDFNGVVTSQIIEFAPTRSMDSEKVYCEVHNSIGGQLQVQSETKTLDLLYHPIVTLSGNTEVEEGNTTILKCTVSSKPKSTVTWYHNDVALSAGDTIVSDSSFEYRIDITNRNNAGTYKCAATNGHKPSDAKETGLLVRYAPDVVVASSNVTVNDTEAGLKCTPSGVPDTYSYLAWEHIWPGYGVLPHSGLGNGSILKLSSLSYEYSGIYKCSASNGVTGSLKPNAGFGETYLQVQTFPIITSPNTMKISSQLSIPTTFPLEFYSNSFPNTVECFRNSSQWTVSWSMEDRTVTLPVFDTTITTLGFVAKVSLLVTHMDHFGVFMCRISNAIGAQTVNVDIVPEGPPEVPQMVSIEDVQSSSVTISWLPGFHGGFDQTFTIEYSNKADEWLQVNIPSDQIEYRLNKTIGGLQTGTKYFFRIKSVNERGTSDYSYTLNATTKVIATEPRSPNNLPVIAGGVFTGVVVFAVVGIVALVFVRKRKAKSTDGSSHQMPAVNAAFRDNGSTGVQRDGMVCDYYNMNRETYESLEYAQGHGHEYDVLGQRPLYEDLSYTNDISHQYGTLENVKEDHPVSNDGKMYENLRLSPLK